MPSSFRRDVRCTVPRFGSVRAILLGFLATGDFENHDPERREWLLFSASGASVLWLASAIRAGSLPDPVRAGREAGLGIESSSGAHDGRAVRTYISTMDISSEKQDADGRGRTVEDRRRTSCRPMRLRHRTAVKVRLASVEPHVGSHGVIESANAAAAQGEPTPRTSTTLRSRAHLLGASFPPHRRSWCTGRTTMNRQTLRMVVATHSAPSHHRPGEHARLAEQNFRGRGLTVLLRARGVDLSSAVGSETIENKTVLAHGGLSDPIDVGQNRELLRMPGPVLRSWIGNRLGWPVSDRDALGQRLAACGGRVRFAARRALSGRMSDTLPLARSANPLLVGRRRPRPTLTSTSTVPIRVIHSARIAGGARSGGSCFCDLLRRIRTTKHPCGHRSWSERLEMPPLRRLPAAALVGRPRGSHRGCGPGDVSRETGAHASW